jgi:hypothetical protein
VGYLNQCEHCNKEWQSSHPGKFCSSNCNHLFKHTQIRDLKSLEFNCLECSSSFMAQKSGVKFCSQSCNNTNWFKNNRSKHNFKEAKRRAKKLQATPKWLSNEDWAKIKEIYDTCPKGYHVDHIMPLQGINISGLHVPWNLQHLPAKENIIKGNKV